MAIYTTLADVERVLRTSAESKIRFSDRALIEVVAKDSNNNTNTDILVDFDSITIDDDYDDQTLLQVSFTSATDYDVFLSEPKIKRNLLLGSGDIASPFTTPDGLITIPSGVFSGTIEIGDTVDLRFDAHMSVNHANAYIDDTEVTVDTVLSEKSVDYLTGAEERLFPTSPEVPVPVKVATQYLAAFYIYTDVFRGKFVDEEAFQKSYAHRWKKRAETMINKYAKTATRMTPVILSFPSFIDEFGLSAAGGAPGSLSDDIDEITRASGSNSIFEP